ncbi:hypothetical protein Patl1_35496 [Pistacia atlantica]|nr:hypothetical protein Patl1_35496 [Pistacia atlantica]
MAKLFGSRGVKTTIITTPANAPLISKSIRKNNDLATEIDFKIINFPSVEAGLPEGCENLDVVATSMEMTMKFFKATTLLREPLEVLLGESKPDCLVADMFFPWATDAAAKFGIPRLVFHGTKPFVVPNLPGDIKLTRKQLPDFIQQEEETEFTMLSKEMQQAEIRSFGTLVNSFYELEPAYADHYRKVLARRAWHIGPVSLCNRNVEDKALRGKQASIDEHECLKWLNSKKPSSVIYVCFGSLANLCSAQLREISLGLEASGQQFIWVQWSRVGGDFVKREAIEKAVKEVMVGDKAVEMRSRAKALGQMAKRAVEERGSSYSDLNAFIEELSLQRCLKGRN